MIWKGLVYVDLLQGINFKVGLNVFGVISMGKWKVFVVFVVVVQKQEGKDLVFVFDVENRIEVIDVKIGWVKDGWIEIIFGFEECSEVVVRDFGLLKVGEFVKVQGKVVEVKQVVNWVVSVLGGDQLIFIFILWCVLVCQMVMCVELFGCELVMR